MFHKNLKALRIKAGLSQKQIAEYLNITPQSVSKWEKGDAQPAIDYLPKLADCLNCDINAFFVLVPEKPINDDMLSDFLALTNEVMHSGTKSTEDINEFICAYPTITDIAIAFCKDLMEYKTLSLKALQGMLDCSNEKACMFLNHLVTAEMIEKLDLENTYFVVKHAINDFIVFLKIKQAIYEKSRDDNYDFVGSLINKLEN